MNHKKTATAKVKKPSCNKMLLLVTKTIQHDEPQPILFYSLAKVQVH